MKEKRFVLEHGDTDPTTLEFGVRVYPIIHGKVLKRFYLVRHCKDIDCQIQMFPRLVPCHSNNAHIYEPEHAYRLESDKEHNSTRRYCDEKCANRNKKRPHVKTKPKEGYPVIEWTKKQWYAYARRCVNP